MSRSYKKNPSCNCVCYFSNKKSRTMANQIMRSKNKRKIRLIIDGIDPDSIAFTSLREALDTYSFSSDGLGSAYMFERDNVNLFHRIIRKNKYVGNKRQESLRKNKREENFKELYWTYRK